MATGNLMKWREYLQKQRGEKDKKKKKMKRGSDGESQRVRGKKRREGEREGRISLGGKVSGPVGVSSRVQSLCGWGRKTGQEGGEGGERTARVSSSMEYV